LEKALTEMAEKVDAGVLRRAPGAKEAAEKGICGRAKSAGAEAGR